MQQGSYSLALIARRRTTTHRWQPIRWDMLSLVLTQDTPQAGQSWQWVRDENPDVTLLRWPALQLKLHRDEVESYYFNLLSATPQLYLLTRGRATPEPFLLSASPDLANALMEAGENEHAYALAMPTSLIEPIERFVLEHYVPEKRRKRRRVDWSGAHSH